MAVDRGTHLEDRLLLVRASACTRNRTTILCKYWKITNKENRAGGERTDVREVTGRVKGQFLSSRSKVFIASKQKIFTQRAVIALFALFSQPNVHVKRGRDGGWGIQCTQPR